MEKPAWRGCTRQLCNATAPGTTRAGAPTVPPLVPHQPWPSRVTRPTVKQWRTHSKAAQAVMSAGPHEIALQRQRQPVLRFPDDMSSDVVQVFREHAGADRCRFTGGLNGRQMANAARLSRPKLPVLFITAYAESVAIGRGALAPGMRLMAKSFAMGPWPVG